MHTGIEAWVVEGRLLHEVETMKMEWGRGTCGGERQEAAVVVVVEVVG